MFSIEITRFRPLRAGAAARHFTLPVDLLSHFETLDRLEQYQIERPASAAPAARQELAAEIVAAARAGKPLPSAAGYTKAELADHAAEMRSAVLAEVLEEQGSALVTKFGALALAIVVEHLRPALAEVVDQAKTPAQLVEHLGTDAENYLRADETTRAALLTLRDLSARYAAIRSARGVFRPYLKLEYDTDGSFGEFRSLHIAAPYYRQPNAPTPWPADPVARLVGGHVGRGAVDAHARGAGRQMARNLRPSGQDPGRLRRHGTRQQCQGAGVCPMTDLTPDSNEARDRAARRRQRIAAGWRHDPRLERMAKLNDEDPERFLRTFGPTGLIQLGCYESGKAALDGIDPLDAA